MTRCSLLRSGIIVIGRNEGERLQHAFRALPNDIPAILYVDSGSTDGSIELAHSLKIRVHRLDPAKPFSAARARSEGAEILLRDYPNLEMIQFVDGDCELLPEWMEKAFAYLEKYQDVGVVCGFLEEAAPGRSVYNRATAVRWNATTGDIDACGGIFMIRRSVYETVGGFNTRLLTGEEAELCSRVRNIKFRVVRLNEKMAYHDANIVDFKDWWTRAVWGGFGDALQYDVLGGKVSPRLRREVRSIIIWTLCAPFMAAIGFFGTIFSRWFMVLPAFCLGCYGALFAKVVFDRLRKHDEVRNAMLYALFCVIGKFPYALGFLKYKMNVEGGTGIPDPHRAKTSKTLKDRATNNFSAHL